MKKNTSQIRIFFFFLIILFTNLSSIKAQNWLWESNGKIKAESKYSNGVSYVNDAEGNFFVTGYYSGKGVSFSDELFLNIDTSGTSYDPFLAKFKKDGKLVWVSTFGGTSYDEGNAVCIDKEGNVYVAGDFRSPSIIIGSSTFFNSTFDGIDSDIFIAKYDSKGHLKWAKSAGGKKNDRATNISIDTLGNVIIIGTSLSSTSNFDALVLVNPDSLSSYLGIEYIAKYDNDGKIISVVEKDKDLKELKKSWDLVFHKCLISNKIKITCAGCYGVRYSVKITVEANGKITNIIELENNQCGEKLSEPFKKCLMDYLNNYNFPEDLRNKTFELRVDRTLKC